MKVRLAVLYRDQEILIRPLDEATVDWLENKSGRVVCMEAMQKLASKWGGSGIRVDSRTGRADGQDLRTIAAEFQQLVTYRYQDPGAPGDWWYSPPLDIEVRTLEGSSDGFE